MCNVYCSPKISPKFRKIEAIISTNLTNTHPYPYGQVKRCSENCKYELLALGLITLSISNSVKIQHPKVYFTSLLEFPPHKKKRNERGRERKKIRKNIL